MLDCAIIKHTEYLKMRFINILNNDRLIGVSDHLFVMKDKETKENLSYFTFLFTCKFPNLQISCMLFD